jgi:hypothetical protein
MMQKDKDGDGWAYAMPVDSEFSSFLMSNDSEYVEFFAPVDRDTEQKNEHE